MSKQEPNLSNPNPRLICDALKAAGFVDAKVIPADDPDITDDEIEITKRIGVQVGPYGVSVGIMLPHDQFLFYPERLRFADLVADIRAALLKTKGN